MSHDETTLPPARGLRPGDDLTSYRAAVDDVLRESRDVWGEQVLSRPHGPTYEALADYLTPIMHCDRTYQTETGVHYLALTEPVDATSFALHVADGSQIIVEYSNLWGSPEWALPFPEPPRGGEQVLVHDLLVGSTADELFGTHRPELVDPRLADGWVPILLNDYEDADGAQWQRESFVTRDSSTGEIASFLALTLVGGAERRDVAIRSRTGSPAEPILTTFALSAGNVLRLRVSNGPSTHPAVSVDPADYDQAREQCVTYWTDMLSQGARLDVPDQHVMDAWRNVIVQNLVLGERYSIGNPYETTFLMEAHGANLALVRWGFTDRATECLDRLADMTNGAGPEWYESWERGVKMAAAAEHARLTGTTTLLDKHLSSYLQYIDDFGTQRRADPHGLLAPERYAWDIPDVVYGWHSQAVAWRGAHDLLAVLAAGGDAAATPQRRTDIDELHTALLTATEASTAVLPDGSAFVPVALFSDERPHEHLTATKLANYWNLVAPYALATGLVRPGTLLARGLFRYMAEHGAWLLGLTRFNGLYDPVTPIGTWREDGTAGYCTPGIDNAFGVQTMFFLADNEEADRIGLAMYSKLAHGMTRKTFVDGEATTVGVREDEYFRSTWYPPNGTSNAMFLESLRLLLVREVRDECGDPAALELGWAVPRTWLRDGATVGVRDLPTSFGPVSFSIDSHLDGGYVAVRAGLPRGSASARLHVRLPCGWRVSSSLAGQDWDPEAGTVLWRSSWADTEWRLPVERVDVE